MLEKFDIPPMWTLGIGVIALALNWIVPFGDFGGPASHGAGVAFGAAGVVLASWAIIRFRLRSTPVEPRNTPLALVDDGPYRFNRNPMYTGLTLLVFGLAVWLGSPASILAVLALPFILTARFIRDEEARLVASFGDEAQAFFDRTRRW
jgi:protein-S-isoprenylcysteine O-methyltransferase Ste14